MVISPVTRKYLNWRRTAAVGCVFARRLAGKPKKYGQRFVQIHKRDNTARSVRRIATTVSEFIDDESVSAAVFLFPYVTDLDRIAEIMVALGEEPEWVTEPTKLPPRRRTGELVALRVVRNIPFEGKLWPSEALMFGDFPEFPPTRRAPVTALELFVGEPIPGGPRGQDKKERANLAHIRLDDLPDHEHFLQMWENSEAGRTRALGGDVDDTRAKAKVTLVVPPDLAHRLGCEQ